MPALLVDSLLFTPGRACAGPLAVVLHQWDSGIEMLDQYMQRCPRPRPAQSSGCEASFHYGISGNCHFHQYIDTSNTAWGFGVQAPTCPTPPCPPTPCESCTGLTNNQYNPDMDGNLPVLPALVAGPDGTANCGVIHVAVSNIFATGLNGICCDPNPKAYECLVNSLAEIFLAAGLVPTQSTLLVHCGELPCLDIDLLVTDVIEAMVPVIPVPVACNCTPTTAQLCSALSTVPDGAAAVPGTTMLLGDDCQFHLLPVPPVADVTVTGIDTATIDITVVEAPTNTFTISANAVTSAILSVINTCNGEYEDQTVVTIESWLDSNPTSTSSRIWASPSEGDCPTILEGVAFDVALPETEVVLGVSTADNTTPTWSKVARPALSSRTFTDANAFISANVDDIFVYTGTIDHDVTLNAPTTSIRRDIWVKNRSANILTITAGSGNIDGQTQITLAGTIPAGYPFGNDGGEVVHLFWDESNWLVI